MSEEEDDSFSEFFRELQGFDESSRQPQHAAAVSEGDRTYIDKRLVQVLKGRFDVHEDGSRFFVRKSFYEVKEARISFYDMQRWLPMISNETFKTVLLPLDVDNEKLNAEIEKTFHGSAFFKLSSVSPKDILPSSRLCVHSASDVRNLLRESQRLQQVLQHRQNDQKIVLRQWEPHLRKEDEFRVFCFQGRVTCVSQYFWTSSFQSLVVEEDVVYIAQSLLNYVNTAVLPRIVDTCGEWVIDVVRLSSTWKVIELNSFGADLNVGACLFHWDLDYEALHQSEGPVSFRILSLTQSSLFVVREFKI